MIRDGGGICPGIVGRQVARGAEVIAERIDDVACRSRGGNLLVGQQLIDSRAPEVAMRDVRNVRGIGL